MEGHSQYQQNGTLIHANTMQENNFAATENILVFGGVGGAGTTTLAQHLQARNIRAFEPHCPCHARTLLDSQDPQLPFMKICVVNSSYYGASRAAELAAQYDIRLVAVMRETPLSIPFGVKVKLRALSGRSDIVLFPHVWHWRKGNITKKSRSYTRALELLTNRVQFHRNQFKGGLQP